MCGFMLKLTGVRRLLCVASTFDSVFSFPSASGNSSAPEHNLFLVKFDNDDDLGERNRGYIRRHHPHAHTAGICRDVGDCICCLQVTVETLRSLMWRSLTLQFRGKHCHMLGGASIEPVTLGLVKPCLSCKVDIGSGVMVEQLQLEYETRGAQTSWALSWADTTFSSSSVAFR
ncbi:uncharacterized protein LOC119170833 isoform X3 [Rhipicephalus microplus]|uniref:uncharacterized protein LOC119170833 isoform X3 n=1 Tax=Rhipicephalus microplus TaxID=6941 RepID=UPI003F6B66CD